MKARREWLKKLAADSLHAWMTAVRPAAFDGPTRIETRHTVYRFEDGRCVDVQRRSGDEMSGAEEFAGMRVVGWLVDAATVVASWRPGARAILWREEGDGAVALTSPAFAFVRPLPPAVHKPVVRSLYWRRPPPSYVRLLPHAITRIGVMA